MMKLQPLTKIGVLSKLGKHCSTDIKSEDLYKFGASVAFFVLDKEYVSNVSKYQSYMSQT